MNRMHIDPRLNDIDDCLYRVAVRALITENNKVLLVQEASQKWWAFPGGGVGHGESVAAALRRELEEELGVPADSIVSNLAIAHYTIGSVVNAVPRMNLFFEVSLQSELLKPTAHVATWAWFTREAFLRSQLNPSFDKHELARLLFKNN